MKAVGSEVKWRLGEAFRPQFGLCVKRVNKLTSQSQSAYANDDIVKTVSEV
jgi:hypothetical protein